MKRKHKKDQNKEWNRKRLKQKRENRKKLKQNKERKNEKKRPTQKRENRKRLKQRKENRRKYKTKNRKEKPRSYEEWRNPPPPTTPCPPSAPLSGTKPYYTQKSRPFTYVWSRRAFNNPGFSIKFQTTLQRVCRLGLEGRVWRGRRFGKKRRESVRVVNSKHGRCGGIRSLLSDFVFVFIAWVLLLLMLLLLFVVREGTYRCVWASLKKVLLFISVFFIDIFFFIRMRMNTDQLFTRLKTNEERK